MKVKDFNIIFATKRQSLPAVEKYETISFCDDPYPGLVPVR
jgi:hypothetical protein